MESLVLWRQLADQDGIASSLNGLGLVELYTGGYTSSRNASKRRWRSGRCLVTGQVLQCLTIISVDSLLPKVNTSWRAFIMNTLWTLRRQLGNADGVAYSYWALAVVALYEGDMEAAETLFRRASGSSESLGIVKERHTSFTG